MAVWSFLVGWIPSHQELVERKAGTLSLPHAHSGILSPSLLYMKAVGGAGVGIYAESSVLNEQLQLRQNMCRGGDSSGAALYLLELTASTLSQNNT